MDFLRRRFIIGRLREIIAEMGGLIVDAKTESCYWMAQTFKARRENKALRQALAEIESESTGRLEAAKQIASKALRR